MTCLGTLTNKGLTVISVDADHFKILGISSLPGDLQTQIIKYAKEHKAQILSEIRIQDSRTHIGDNPTHIGNATWLPIARFCPAQCTRTGLCHGTAYFKGKTGKGQPCDLDQCLYKNQITAFDN